MRAFRVSRAEFDFIAVIRLPVGSWTGSENIVQSVSCMLQSLMPAILKTPV
jgi:hypothetical protein